jgi:putative acetyltransferase
VQIEQVRTLFTEYRAELAVEPCFVSFEAELKTLPGDYAPPPGKLLLAKVIGQPVACVALRPFAANGICEMKRLYVRPPFRGDKIGRKLAERLIADARQLGYSTMRLDSHMAAMQKAIEMYRKLGFYEIGPEPLKPVAGVIYMERALT